MVRDIRYGKRHQATAGGGGVGQSSSEWMNGKSKRYMLYPIVQDVVFDTLPILWTGTYRTVPYRTELLLSLPYQTNDFVCPCPISGVS